MDGSLPESTASSRKLTYRRIHSKETHPPHRGTVPLWAPDPYLYRNSSNGLEQQAQYQRGRTYFCQVAPVTPRAELPGLGPRISSWPSPHPAGEVAAWYLLGEVMSAGTSAGFPTHFSRSLKGLCWGKEQRQDHATQAEVIEMNGTPGPAPRPSCRLVGTVSPEDARLKAPTYPPEGFGCTEVPAHKTELEVIQF